jgi:hypothetical protein
LLKSSAVYLIGKAEIFQDPPTWIQDDQTLLLQQRTEWVGQKKSEIMVT